MTNNKEYRVSDEEFIEVVSAAKNISEALKSMGLEPLGGNYKTFYNRCIKLNIEPPKRKTLEKEKRKVITDDQIKLACENAQSRRNSLIILGLKRCGSNTKWIDKKIKELHIDTSQWVGQGHLRGKTHNWNNKIPLEKILIKDSTYSNNNSLKIRLFKAGLLTDKCYICEISTWHGKKLSLHLDHINGDKYDNRLENLRLLCPNCHSLTDTYTGKNAGRYIGRKQPSAEGVDRTIQDNIKKLKENKIQLKKVKILCPVCSKNELSTKAAKKCLSCHHKSQEKISWPDNEILLQMIKDSNFLAVSKKLGVSDNAIRHRLKSRGLL